MSRLDCIKLVFVAIFMMLLNDKARKRFVKEVGDRIHKILEIKC